MRERERDHMFKKDLGTCLMQSPAPWSLSDLASVTPLPAENSLHLGALSCLGLHDTSLWRPISSLANYHLSFAPLVCPPLHPSKVAYPRCRHQPPLYHLSQ